MGLTAADADRYVFRAPMGGPLRYFWWHEKVWDRARREVGLGELGFHDLRRLYASVLVAEAIDVKVSQELMGHEDIRMTRGLYAQAGSVAKQRANDAVADHLLARQRDLARDRRAMERG
ncbi:MAG: tyrosine-type recombinase/integrase [Acidimicrobiales bacterium]